VFNDGGVLFMTGFLCSQTSMNAQLELTTVQQHQQQLVPILLEVLLVDATLDTQGME